MISEVENILKGSVVKTQDFESSRKLIGVAEQNLQPNAQGEIALAKQNAFIVEKKEEPALETLDNALNPTPVAKEEPVESLELNNPSVETPQPAPAQENVDAPAEVQSNKFTSELNNIPEPDENNVVLENPISVEDPNALSKLTNPLEEMSEEVTPNPEPSHAEVNLDLQMPKLPTDVIVPETSELTGNIFEQVPTPMPATQSEMPVVENVTIPTSQPELPTVENTPTPIPQDNNLNIEIPKLEKNKEETVSMDEMIQKIDELSSEFNRRITELKELIEKNKKVNSNEISALEPTQENQNNLVNDALSQINNMVIPNAGTETLKL